MRRFWLLFLHEIRLVKSTWLIHLVAIIQPALMFWLMSQVLVRPIFPMYVLPSNNPEQPVLVDALQRVGSPIGEPYVELHLASPGAFDSMQVIQLTRIDGQTVALQRFNLIDSNLVKNFRNRLTAAALIAWQDQLGNQAVRIVERPLLPHDIPYSLYFGIALIPMTAFFAASLTGALLTALDFENGMVLAYRLSPRSPGWVFTSRLLRLMLTGIAAAVILAVAVGLVTGYWPGNVAGLILVVLPVSLVGAALGMNAANLLQKTLPAFVISLAFSMGMWMLGDAFGLAAGFGNVYEALSKWVPHSYAVQLLFANYYGAQVGSAMQNWLMLLIFSFVFLFSAVIIYYLRVVRGAGS